jgi:putative oxidoreductase
MTDTNQAGNGPKLLIPTLSGLYCCGREAAYPLLRIVAGGFLTPHGWGKLSGGLDGTAQFFANMGLEPAYLLATIAGAQEFVGGICIALGLLTRFWAAGRVILMAVAVLAVHLPNGFMVTNGGYEYALLWMVVLIYVLFRGAGRVSIDRLVGREL